MTAQEIIEKIRAEVERLMQGEQQDIKDMEGALVPNLRSYTKGKRDAFIDTLIALDKLKELPITRDFNFDDEVVKWIQEHSDVDGTYSGIDFAHHFYELGKQKEQSEKPTNIDFEQELYKHFGQVKDFTLGMQIGKYFYELGKQEKPKKGLHSGSLGKVDNPMKWMEEDAEERTTAEGLEEEIKRFQKEIWDHDTTLSDVARHFAKWGAEHRSSLETPKDLESYAQKVEDYYDVGEERGYLCVHRGEMKCAVIAGAKWQKEQMMKDGNVILSEEDFDAERGGLRRRKGKVDGVGLQSMQGADDEGGGGRRGRERHQ